MIRIADNLWVGNSIDGQAAKVDAVLNVATDLHVKRGWPDVVYAQVGLIDGPGNPLSAYYAAVLALASLVRPDKHVLVHCHEGKSRSVAVALMYRHAVTGRGWDNLLSLVRERVEIDVPNPHEAHRAAFERMDWGHIASVVGAMS